MAYQAMGREDLLSAINEFLDDSVVLPPGEWHRNTLLPIVALAKEKAMRKKAAKRDKEKEGKSGRSPPFKLNLYTPPTPHPTNHGGLSI
jgi:hypothetical protein